MTPEDRHYRDRVDYWHDQEADMLESIDAQWAVALACAVAVAACVAAMHKFGWTRDAVFGCAFAGAFPLYGLGVALGTVAFRASELRTLRRKRDTELFRLTRDRR